MLSRIKIAAYILLYLIPLNAFAGVEDLKDSDHVMLMASIFDLLSNDDQSKIPTSEPDYMGRNDPEIAVIPPLYSVDDISMNTAKIRIIDVHTGISKEFYVTKDIIKSFDKLSFKLISCWKQGEALLSRESKALMVITDHESNDLVFDGWLFSRHKGFAQPRYKKFFITLSECYAEQ